MKGVFIFSICLFIGCNQVSDELTSEWEYFLPNQKGANSYALLALDDVIKDGAFGDIHSLMMVKNQSVIFENYYNGHKKNELHSLGRATQSIFTMFLDTLLKISDLTYDDRIIDLFPQHADLFDNVPQKDKIAINHLIYHRSGFWWDDENLSGPLEVNDLSKMQDSKDWVRFILSTKMIREPGMDFNFNSGHYILLSDVLERRFDNTTKEKIDELFFQKMGIDQWEWSSTPSGILNSISGLSLSTENMVKMGMVFLNDGNWKGEEIIPENWIVEMKRNLAQDGYYQRSIGWLKLDRFHPALNGNMGIENYLAWGVGGKFIVIFPEYDFVMVLTGDFENNYEEFVLANILRNYILPSLNSKLITT